MRFYTSTTRQLPGYPPAMSKFIELFPDMEPVLSAIFRAPHLEALGLANEVPDIASLGFSGVSFDIPFLFEENAVQAPFGSGSVVAPNKPGNGLSSADDNPTQNSDLALPSTSTSADNAPQNVSRIQRQLGDDTSSKLNTTTYKLPFPVVCSSKPRSGASSAEAEIPETIAAVASSSSPAGKSARQRKKMGSDTSSRNSNSRDTPIAQGTQTDGKKPCRVRGCDVRFCDKTTMLRHILSNHLEICPTCPGCDSTYSRPDSLKRHLENRSTHQRCRDAVQASGWQVVELDDGRIKVKNPTREKRTELVAAYGF